MATKNSKVFSDISKIAMITINAIITIKDIVKGYIDNSENEEGGISSMDGRLNIRPRYQRAYIVPENSVWKENLINSILCGFPINRLYIGVCGDDLMTSPLEMLDGQQRVKTICDFINGKFAIRIDGAIHYWCNLDESLKNTILNYSLDVTYCKGDESARIKWFKRINQPNSILTEQELRNATYLGTFLESAKRFFCGTSNRSIKQINNKDNKYCITKYTTAKAIERCEFLEVALDWVSYLAYEEMRDDKCKDERICRYMAEHQHDANADELINTYKSVIDWIVDVYWKDEEGYPSSQSFKNVDWVKLFCNYKDLNLSYAEKRHITERCLDLVNNYKAFSSVDGVYEWVIRGEKDDEVNTYLSLRGFSKRDLDNMYAVQKGIDPIDGKHYDMSEMEAHHIVSWRNGGVSDFENLVWLSKENHKKVHADLFITSYELRCKRDALRKENGFL